VQFEPKFMSYTVIFYRPLYLISVTIEDKFILAEKDPNK